MRTLPTTILIPAFFLIAVTSIVTSPATATTFAQTAAKKDLKTLFSEIVDLRPEDRLLKSTEFFRDTQTGLDPLGEGKGLDPDPTFSTKIFDCTTYVETNLAVALSKTEAEVPAVLSQIRYRRDVVDFFQRNHFMVSDWIPANSKKGFVKEMTSTLTDDKSAYQSAKKSLKKTLWFFHRTIDLLDKQKKTPKEILEQLSHVPVETDREEKTTFLTAEYFRTNETQLLEKLPAISIVMMIRNIPTTPTLVNHMGFLVKREGRLFFNHAPQAKPWRVQELPVEDYFKDLDSHRAPVEGILVLKVKSER